MADAPSQRRAGRAGPPGQQTRCLRLEDGRAHLSSACPGRLALRLRGIGPSGPSTAPGLRLAVPALGSAWLGSREHVYSGHLFSENRSLYQDIRQLSA